MNIEQQTANILREIHQESEAEARPPAVRLVDGCRAATGAEGVSVTWCAPGSAPLTIAATSGVGEAMEQLSFLVGDGPQTACVRSGRIVSRPHLAASNVEWPWFTAEALREGVAGIFAFPLRLGGISLGVLSIYRAQPGVLSADQFTAAFAYAAAATALLLDSGRNTSGEVLPAILDDPLELQAEVHQATGMIAADLDVDLITALSILRAYAYSNSQSITVVARDVVTRTIRIT